MHDDAYCVIGLAYSTHAGTAGDHNLVERYAYDAYGRRHAYGQPIQSADFNEDGAVDLQDFTISESH
ncbi:MAG: hypothetical protein AAGA57_09335 [Planctomycetota bacterium]